MTPAEALDLLKAVARVRTIAGAMRRNNKRKNKRMTAAE